MGRRDALVLGRYSPRIMYKDDKQPAAYTLVNSIVSTTTRHLESSPIAKLRSSEGRDVHAADLGLILYMPTHVVASHPTAVIILLLPLGYHGLSKGGSGATMVSWHRL